MRYGLPRAIDMDCHLPLISENSIVAAFILVMVGQFHNDIDASPRIENEFEAVLFAAMPVRGSVRRRPVPWFFARCWANRHTLARDKQKHRANQGDR